MGRPIGSKNRELPFNSALRLALRGDPLRLRRIAEKLAEKAEEGDLAAIRELADRLDGKPPQAHTGEDDGDLVVVIRQISDITMPHGELCDAVGAGPDQFAVKRLAAK
jgi:hypothetical protein